MIKGIGVDIASIKRIKKMVTGYGDHFLNRVYTESEIAYCRSLLAPEVHFAGRWAAKEAFYKALPTNAQQFSTWKSIEIISNGSGPIVNLLDYKLKEELARLGISNILVSISHEKKYAVANVCME